LARELAGSGEVTLVSENNHFLFTPMLYEYLSGEVEEWHIAPEYNELLDDKVRFIQGAVANVDPVAQTVSLTNSSDPISYDVLVLAIGGITNYVGVPGAEEHSPFRKIAHADHLRQVMVSALDRIPPETPPQDVRKALTLR
jgi:NADH dehydrogenase